MVDKVPDKAEALPGPALGFIETASIARGVEALDALLKRARVEVLLTTIVPRGKYLILFGGGVADVEEALKGGLESAGKSVLDSSGKFRRGALDVTGEPTVSGFVRSTGDAS